jgi:hypothetical protein
MFPGSAVACITWAGPDVSVQSAAADAFRPSFSRPAARKVLQSRRFDSLGRIVRPFAIPTGANVRRLPVTSVHRRSRPGCRRHREQSCTVPPLPPFCRPTPSGPLVAEYPAQAAQITLGDLFIDEQARPQPALRADQAAAARGDGYRADTDVRVPGNAPVETNFANLIPTPLVWRSTSRTTSGTTVLTVP